MNGTPGHEIRVRLAHDLDAVRKEHRWGARFGARVSRPGLTPGRLKKGAVAAAGGAAATGFSGLGGPENRFRIAYWLLSKPDRHIIGQLVKE
jgi:hypothetical protein